MQPNDIQPRPPDASEIQFEDYRKRGVTLRVVLIALLVAPVNAFFMADLHRRAIEDPTVVSLFWNCLFMLVMFRLVNSLLLRWAPRFAFSPAELLTFFILISVSTCASGLDTLKTSIGTMQGYAYFASPENHWEDLFGDFLPLSMTVNDLPAIERLWKGDSSIFDPRNYKVWGPVIFRWWLFFTCLWGCTAGLAVFFRKRWVERERMSFPIVQLPFEVSQVSPSSIKHPALWIAFGVAASIGIINGFHVFYPQIPQIPVKIGQSPMMNLSRFFVGRPWNAVGRLHACFYPFITGLGMLLPQDMSLSLWLFHLLWKAEAIATSWFGLNSIREFPYMKEQSFGGYLAIIGFALWAARPYFKAVWERIIGGGDPEHLHGGPDLRGGGGDLHQDGLVGLRCVLRAVLPDDDDRRANPGGDGAADPRDRAPWAHGHAGEYPGPEQSGRSEPHFAVAVFRLHAGAAMLVASMCFVPVGIFFAYFWYLYLGYRYGWGADWSPWMPWSSQEAWRQLTGWLTSPKGFHWGRTIATGVGFVIYFGLMVVRTRWVWWPIHPAGFAISTTWYMSHMWTPMLIAWSTKSLVARYGGLRAVRALPAIAFGLILGDVMTGAGWTIYSLITRVNTYAFWP